MHILYLVFGGAIQKAATKLVSGFVKGFADKIKDAFKKKFGKDLGNISKKNADKNNDGNTETADETKLLENANYQTKLQNCANLAKKLDTKAGIIFHPNYVATLGATMTPRYQDMQNRYEALKRAIADPDVMEILKKAGVTIEQIEARFQQFEKQFDVLEKTKSVKEDIYKKSNAGLKEGDTPKNVLENKNIAFSKISLEIPMELPNGQGTFLHKVDLNLLSISGKQDQWLKNANLDLKEVPIKEILKNPAEAGTFTAYEYQIGKERYYIVKDDAAIASMFSQKIKQRAADGSKSEKDTGVDFSNLGYREGYHLNAQDSERKIAMFAQGLSQDQSLNPSPQQKKLKPGIKVTKTTFDTEMSPCNSCAQVVDEFKNSNKNVDTELSYGVGFVHENPKGTDEKSNFLKKNGDITDFLIN